MLRNSLHKALWAKYEAEKAEAEATLEVYFTNSVGIGEHPQIVEEMSKQLEKLANAQDCLQSLMSMKNKYEEGQD
tara:strand:- start:320 stop:544 length:225 start_codon:yes stop_codon:yes gene_type:complete